MLSQQLEMMAEKIAGERADDEIYELARRVAEAQIELQRVQLARHQILSDLLNSPTYDVLEGAPKNPSIISSLVRPIAPVRCVDEVKEHLTTSAPERASHKLAKILIREETLRAMDRYERRAVSRRKFAIRALDDARRDIGI